MKEIINGRTYNTATAELIAEWDNGAPCNDFRYCYEALYKKHTGEFFLRGEGGPLSCYREVWGDGTTTGGTQLVPMTLEEAKKWLEKYGDVDEYIAVFGEPEE